MSAAFPADWLTLREPYDHAARAAVLAGRLAAWAAGRGTLDIVDLGAGLGSNLRWLAPRLPSAQRWRLVENDPALVERGQQLCPQATYVRADLVADLELALRGPLDLISASALLDLVSAAWARRLVAVVRARRCAVLLAISYNGRLALQPADPLDGHVTELVNRHQRHDKGFGPALGPTAAAVLSELLAACDGELRAAPSPWRLEPQDAALQSTLVSGWAAAAAAVAPADAARIGAWRQRRLRWIAAHRSAIQVGHDDLLWLPRP